jgi:hypothetical protein
MFSLSALQRPSAVSCTNMSGFRLKGAVMADRIGAGCLAGMFLWAFSAPGFGLALFAVALVSIAGQFVGNDKTLLTVYVVGAMGLSYVAPVVLAIVNKSLGWLIGVPIITSFVFAIPSSFVRLGACEGGFDDLAPWTMRAIPLWWLVESLHPQERHIYCD